VTEKLTSGIRTEFLDWLIIVVIVVWFFFLLNISTKQAEHKKAIESGNVFYAPDYSDGFSRAIVTPVEHKKRLRKTVRN